MTSDKLKTELLRKAIHFANIWIPLSYVYIFTTKESFITFFMVISIISVIIELSRVRLPFMKNLFNRWFNFMLKDHELKGRLTGASWTFIGAVIVGVLFSKDVAIISLLFLHVGDPMAAIIGLKFGKTKAFGKTLEGTSAGVIACIIVALPFTSIPIYSRILAASWAMLMELLPWRIDDNVIIPLSGALMLWITQ